MHLIKKMAITEQMAITEEMVYLGQQILKLNYWKVSYRWVHGHIS